MEDSRTVEIVERELVALAAQLEQGLARWLALVGEYDKLDAARAAGFRGTAEWLAWRCQISPRTAREHVRVARRLSEMPAVNKEFSAGRLSYSKARAITRAHASEDENELLTWARRMTAAQLENHVRALPTAPSADPDAERVVYEERYLDYRWDEQGALCLHGRLPAVEGAALIEALETAAEVIHPKIRRSQTDSETGAAIPAETSRSAARRPSLLARRADALCELGQSGAPGSRVLLHTTRATLCAIDNGPAIPVEAGRRLACDAIVEDADGADLGRKRRVVSPALRAALQRRDGGCRYPGCDRRHGLHAHHIKHWAHGGSTDQTNLIMLCRFHHRLVHEGGFTVTDYEHRSVFISPTGEMISELPTVAI